MNIELPVWERVSLPDTLFQETKGTAEVGIQGSDQEGVYFPIKSNPFEAFQKASLPESVARYMVEMPNQHRHSSLGASFNHYVVNDQEGALIVGQPQKRQTIHLSHRMTRGANVFSYAIYAKTGSHLEIVLDFEDVDPNHLHTQVTLYAQANSKVKIVNLQRLQGQSASFQNMTLHAEEGADITIADLQLGAAFKASNVYQTLAGMRTEAKIYTLYYVDKDSQADLQYTLRHQGKKTQGHILSKGAMAEGSKKVFRGNLVFDTGATQSVSKEEEFCVLLAKKLKSDSIPGLFCAEDDVIGEHAASIGQIDENKLFYLKSRGFNEQTAKQMLIRGAYEEVLKQLDIPEIVDAVHQKLDALIGA